MTTAFSGVPTNSFSVWALAFSLRFSNMLCIGEMKQVETSIARPQGKRKCAFAVKQFC